MSWMVVFGLLAAGQRPAPVPPPPDLVVADCSGSTYASDLLVCQDAGLLDLDRQLAGEIAARSDDPGGTDDDRDWFRRSRLCAFETTQRDCLVAAYCLRISWFNGGSGLGPAACRPSADDFMTVSAVIGTDAGDATTARRLDGREIRIRGFVDAQDVSDGPDGTTWQFRLRADARGTDSHSLAVSVPDDSGTDDVRRVFAADAAAGRATQVYLTGTFRASQTLADGQTRDSWRVELPSSRVIRTD